MSTVSAPFGLKPVYHQSGTVRPRSLAGGIASAYGSNLFLGTPVKFDTNGQLNVSTGTDSIIGAFAGVEYVDATGRPHTQGYWPASTVATQITAHFHQDPTIQYAIQATGSLAQTSVGDMADITNPGAGNTSTQVSTAAISTTLVGAGNSAQLQILDLYATPDNAWGDAYTTVVVRINEHQLQATVNAI